VVRVFKWLKKRIRKAAGVSSRSGTGWTDDDRRLSEEVRQLNAKKRRIQKEIEIARQKKELLEIKAELEELNEEREYRGSDIDNEEDTSIEDKLMLALLSRLFPGGGQTTSSEFLHTPTSPGSEDAVSSGISDDSIRQAIKGIPKRYLKEAKKLPDDVLISVVMKHMAVGVDTAKRAVEIFRKEI
jgi:hypothetical protein